MKQSFSLKIYLFGYEKTDLKYEWKIYHVHKGEQNQLENPNFEMSSGRRPRDISNRVRELIFSPE